MEFKQIAEHQLYSCYITRLREASYDKSNNEYLSESVLPVLNFDEMVAGYASALSIPCPSSADAFFCASDEEGWLIEFKNGVVDRRNRHSLEKKIYDSVLVLADITGKPIEECRGKLTFVLVLNREKNTKHLKEVTAPSDSKALSAFACMLSEKGGKRFIPYGLGKFQNYILKDIIVVDDKDFDSVLLKDL